MEQTITIVNIASGIKNLLNEETVQTIKTGGQLILRTSRTPIVSWLKQEKIDYLSLDDIYEITDDFDQLTSLIAERLWSLAENSPIVYAVPDMITDRSVRSLYSSRPACSKIRMVPGMGLSDVYRSEISCLLPDSDLRTVSSFDFLTAAYDPGTSLLVTELDNEILAGAVKIHLSGYLEDEYSVYYLHGQDDPVEIPLYELDRQSPVDHLSAVLIPGTGFLKRTRFVLNDLVNIMDRLLSDDGCPWDRAQTHHSLRPYLVEEAWECIAAIDEEDTDHLCEELGDLLFQIVFHACIGKIYDEFTICDIISSICSKMIRRHPHVFGGRHISDQNTVRAEWEKIKREETGRHTVIGSLDDVSTALPSLKYASKIQKKLNQIESLRGTAGSIFERIRTVISHLESGTGHSSESDLGELLLLCAQICSSMGYDGEILLHQSVDIWKAKLKKLETRIMQDGKSLEDLTFDELGVYLEHVEDEIE